MSQWLGVLSVNPGLIYSSPVIHHGQLTRNTPQFLYLNNDNYILIDE